MRFAFRLICLGWLGLVCTCLYAQIQEPPIPLQLDGDPRPVQIPGRALLYSPQCDSQGAIYVRYSLDDQAHPGSMVRIESDGKTKNISPVALADPAGDVHVFLFAAAGDDSLHEIVRLPTEAAEGDGATEERYISFDEDGSLHTQVPFADQFIPSMLVPLPSGDFFAAGVVLDSTNNGVSEGPIAGIFDSDARLKRRLQNTPNGLVSVADASPNNSAQTSLEGAVIQLGGDGNLYALLPGEATRIDVVSQAGRVLRHMDLEQPFANAVADDMRLSGNRLLVVYEAEGGEGATTAMYVLYDAQTGEVIRQYRPEFLGTVACFEDGQTVSVLVKKPSTGALAVGTAELE